MKECEDVYMLRLFTTNLDSNINLNKKQVKNIVSYITELEKYYNYYINLLNAINELKEEK